MTRFAIIALAAIMAACGGSQTEDNEQALPKVYMTTEITPEGLVSVYEALGVEAHGNVAVKISTGEPGALVFSLLP